MTRTVKAAWFALLMGLTIFLTAGCTTEEVIDAVGHGAYQGGKNACKQNRGNCTVYER